MCPCLSTAIELAPSNCPLSVPFPPNLSTALSGIGAVGLGLLAAYDEVPVFVGFFLTVKTVMNTMIAMAAATPRNTGCKACEVDSVSDDVDSNFGGSTAPGPRSLSIRNFVEQYPHVAN